MEYLEVGNPLPGREEGDRLSHHLFDREGCSAACVAVNLGQDDAVELKSLVKRLSGSHCILAGHGIDDEEGVVGVHGLGYSPHLVHELAVDREPAGGVDDHEVTSESFRLCDATAGNGDRIGGLGEDAHSDLGTEDPQLLDSRRPLEVGSDQIRMATLLAEPPGELCGRGRLARALKACEQHDRRWLRHVRDLQCLAAQSCGQLLVDDLDDLLGRGEMLGKLGPGASDADPLDEVLDDSQIDVGLEKGDSDLAQDLCDLGVPEAPAAAKAREDPLEAIGQCVEHEPDQVSRAGAPAP